MDLNAKSICGRTAFIEACAGGNADVALELFQVLLLDLN